MINGMVYLLVTLLILVIGVFVKNKKIAITSCGFLALCISAITVYNEGIYVDEMNLQGNILSFIIVIINIILFVVLVIFNQKEDKEE